MKEWHPAVLPLVVLGSLGLSLWIFGTGPLRTLQAQKPLPRTTQSLLDTETRDFCQVHSDGTVTRGTAYRTQTCAEWRATVAAYAVSEWSASGAGSIADRWLCYLLDPCLISN